MKPFDDRPRPSAPAPKNAKKCFRCRTVFPFTQPKDGKPGHQYGYKSDDAGESICKETRACRSRVLGAQIGRELGQDEDWLFARTPRDRYAALMDVRPGKPTAWHVRQAKVMKPGEEWKQQGWLPAWESMGAGRGLHHLSLVVPSGLSRLRRPARRYLSPARPRGSRSGRHPARLAQLLSPDSAQESAILPESSTSINPPSAAP